MQYYTLKIINLSFETTDTLTVSFKQPGLKRIKYSAGQYLSLIFRINGRRYVRPYSFSSSPGVDNTLNITVKRVPGGIVSNHIIDTLTVDDLVEVMEPMGDFILNDEVSNINTHVYLWGAGSGITPLFSISKYALHHRKAGLITLIYGNRHFENIIFKKEIERLMHEFENQFFVKHFVTQPFVDEHMPNTVQGRITAKDVKEIMLKRKADLSHTLHYICGQTGLKESIKTVLTNLGVPDENIFSEDFEVTKDPKEFENIITQKVRLRHAGNIMEIEVAAGKSILEAGLDALVDLPYSCQTGNCLVCKGKLINGRVKTIGVANLPGSLRSNEHLLCCSFPLTDDIEIAIE
jgi:ring-1,2-phenylacetyl-CoA epoxidase subunit PaaE